MLHARSLVPLVKARDIGMTQSSNDPGKQVRSLHIDALSYYGYP